MRRTISLAICVCVAVSQFAPAVETNAAQPAQVSAKLLHNIPSSVFYWWSPDNKTLAVLGSAGMQLHDAATGKARAEIKPDSAAPPPAETPTRVYFTPDSRFLVVHAGRVRVFDAADGKFLRAFAYNTSPANAHDRVHKPVVQEAVSYDSNNPTYPGETTTTYPSDEAELQELPTAYVSDRVISPDGKLILVSAKEGKAQAYDLGTGELRYTLEPLADAGRKKGRDGYGSALAEFSPDGRLVVTTHRNLTPRLWDAATGRLVADLGPQSEAVYGARFSPDGRFVATTSFDGLVRIWDAATGKLRHTVGSASKKDDRTYFAQWNPVDSTFVVKTRAWEIQIWNAETGRLVSKLDQKAADEKFDKNLTFVYSPDGKTLLTKARNNGNRISPLTLLTSLKGKHKFIAHLWDAASGSLVASLRDTDKFDYEAYANDKFFWGPSGDYLITAGPTVKIWNRRGEFLHELEHNARLNASLSPDGRLLAVTEGLEPNLIKDIAMLGKILVGKLPKMDWTTSVWQIEDKRP